MEVAAQPASSNGDETPDAAAPPAESAAVAANETSSISIDAFGAMPSVASRIGGVRHGTPAEDPAYAFHSEYVHCHAGAAIYTVDIAGLTATRGSLTLTVNGQPHRHGDAAFVLEQRIVPLSELAAAGGTVAIPFDADIEATYALIGSIHDDTDAAAQSVTITLERGPVASAHLGRLIAARDTVFAVPAVGVLEDLIMPGTATLADPVSQMCTAAQMAEPFYDEWVARMGQQKSRHRKQWEFVYILQMLRHHGLLRPGMRGLGFGVGVEPLPAVMAAMGCTIVATDLPADHRDVAGWSATNQHVAGIDQLRRPEICANDVFDAHVSFRPVDMTAVPDDLTDFDFTWSSCAYEHLGSIPAGLRFVENSVRCLKPGGIAVHTTELNLSSNGRTVDRGGTVLFRRRDLERLAKTMLWRGHHVAPFKYDQGDSPLDIYIDAPPYRGHDHLKIALSEFVTTSFGIMIRRGPAV